MVDKEKDHEGTSDSTDDLSQVHVPEKRLKVDDDKDKVTKAVGMRGRGTLRQDWVAYK